MSRDAGANLLLTLFAVLCVLTIVGSPGLPAIGIAGAGLIASLAAWRRNFAGFVAVLIVCALAAVADVLGLLASSRPTGGLFGWLRPALFAALALALLSSRRQFRPRPTSLSTDDAA